MSEAENTETATEKQTRVQTKDLVIAILGDGENDQNLAGVDRSRAKAILKQIKAERHAEFPRLVALATSKTGQGRRAFTSGSKNYKVQKNPAGAPVLRLPAEGLGLAVGSFAKATIVEREDGSKCMVVEAAPAGEVADDEDEGSDEGGESA